MEVRARHDVGVLSINEFSGMNRYWDETNGIVAVKILPGEYYVTKDDELITTVLGSCISACVCDSVAGIGGMNHFMLPEMDKQRKMSLEEHSLLSSATRYGNYAMEHLINTILSNGGKRKNLEIKVFGGANVISGMTGSIGHNNIAFILDYIDAEGMLLLSSDLGGNYPRKVNFYPKTGRVRMKKIKNLHDDKVLTIERQYQNNIKGMAIESDIELF